MKKKICRVDKKGEEKIFVTCRKFKLLPSNYWGYVMGLDVPTSIGPFIPQWASPASIAAAASVRIPEPSRRRGTWLTSHFWGIPFCVCCWLIHWWCCCPVIVFSFYHTSLVSLLSVHDYAIYSLLVCWMREEEEEQRERNNTTTITTTIEASYGRSIHSSRSRRPGNRCSTWLFSFLIDICDCCFPCVLFLQPASFTRLLFVCLLQLETDKVSQIFDLTIFFF